MEETHFLKLSNNNFLRDKMQFTIFYYVIRFIFIILISLQFIGNKMQLNITLCTTILAPLDATVLSWSQ